MKFLLIALFLLASLDQGLAQSSSAPKAKGKAKTPARKSAPKAAAAAVADVPIKVAEGKYKLMGSGVTPGRKFEEPWTLYRTKVGFELKESFVVSQNGEPNPGVEITVGFAPGFFPTSIVIAGENNKNPITCTLKLALFTCDSVAGISELPMEGSYSFFLPDPWMMGAVVRRAKPVPDVPTKVAMVRMAGMTPTGPKLERLEAVIHYVGEDQVEVVGTRQMARIYEIKVERYPNLTLWITRDGVVSAMEDSRNTDQRMELIEYKKIGKF